MPCYEVPRASGTGTRPTTLADARKLGLLPSVTNILAILDKPALTEWKVRQAVMAVVTAPDVPGEAIDAKIVRVLEREQQQDEEAAKARDFGTMMHAELEAIALGLGATNPEVGYHATRIFEALTSEHGEPEAVEKVVVGCGYAGKADLILDSIGYRTVVDYKTTTRLPKAPWPEHALQLAAYAAAGLCTRRVSVYIDSKNLGKFVILPHETRLDDDFKAFQAVQAVWQYMKGYKP